MGLIQQSQSGAHLRRHLVHEQRQGTGAVVVKKKDEAFRALLDDYVSTKYHKRETPLPATTPQSNGARKDSLRVIA